MSVQGIGRPRKERCPIGHAYDEANTYTDKNGGRHCRKCRTTRMKTRRSGGPGQGANNTAKTHCPKQHEYTPENTYLRDGKRTCRECARLNSANQTIKKYGLTIDQFNDMLVKQGTACKICRKPFDPEKIRGKRGSIDHDHACCPGPYSCGKCVRGILCTNCNNILGQAHDDPDVLRAAVAYLESR